MTKKSFKIKGNLAEALGDTVTSAINNAGELHIEIIPLRKITLDPNNPRELLINFNDLQEGINKQDPDLQRKITEKESLSSLAKSIVDQGVINPIVVYKENERYHLIAGERRTLASIIANKQDIPAKILTSKPNPLKMSLIQWIENIEREDLSLWERMKNLEKIISAYSNSQNIKQEEITPTTISQLLGCSLQQAVNYNNVLNASANIKEHIKTGGIKNIEKAAFIAKAGGASEQALLQLCIQGATPAQLKNELKKMNSKQLQNTIVESKDSNKKKSLLESKITKKAAKSIIEIVLQHEIYKHLSSEFKDINWEEEKAVSNAFTRLLKLLEKY